jgi:hypothetical protein
MANGDKQAMLIGIAGVAVVVWTAGFVVRSLGHRPNRGLIAAMNYAQLSFMGGLVAAFLTPIALQAVALLFLLQELYQVPHALYTRAKRPDQRTFGEQQYIDMLGIETRAGAAQYLALEAPYVACILLILRWPSQFVAIPLLWLALYLSYQIMIFFLFAPRDGETANPTPASGALPPIKEQISVLLLRATQQRIFSNLDNAIIVQKVFGGNAQAHAEARMLVQQLDNETTAMSQWHAAPNAITPLLGSAYLRAILQHRLAAGRLVKLISNACLSDTPSGVLEKVLTAEQTGLPLVRYSVDANGILMVNLFDLQTSTTTGSFAVYLLAESYIEEINGVLARLDALLVG